MLPVLYVMVGLPGSGKSTYAKTLGCPIVSSDAVRAELYGDESIQGSAHEVFNIVHKRINDYLHAGKSCVYDATNLSIKNRNPWPNIPECRKVAVVVDTPYAQCLERNATRKRKVPENVIARMAKKFQMPTAEEGFDEVLIV